MQYAILACHTCAVSVTSASQSVALVDCDHIVQQNWKLAHDRIGRCLSYLHAEADPYCNILWSRILLRKTTEYGKCGAFSFQQLTCYAIFICWASRALNQLLLCAVNRQQLLVYCWQHLVPLDVAKYWEQWTDGWPFLVCCTQHPALYTTHNGHNVVHREGPSAIAECCPKLYVVLLYRVSQ